MRRVRHQVMSAQVRLEEALAERQRLLGSRGVEAVSEPRFLAALHDERAELRIEAIGMNGEPAVLGLFENKRERVERQRRTEPDETATALVELRTERLGVRRSDATI